MGDTDRWVTLVRSVARDLQDEWDEARRAAAPPERSAAVRARVRKLKRPRRADDDDVDARPLGGGEEARTCVVCLEDRRSARSRCVTAGCGAAVCQTCHRDLRGLCPVCERAALNDRYGCGRCGRAVPLTAFGYECAGCSEPALCRACHTLRGACGACA